MGFARLSLRYFIELSYDGTAYCGWQIQPNGESVQGTLQKALAALLREDIAVTGAGRTDAGVHAAKMVAHVDIPDELSISTTHLEYRLNAILPHDIAIHKIYPVADDAHARFSARARTYYYYVHTRKSPFLRDRSWRLVKTPDFESMNLAAAVLLEYEDFTSFSKVNTDTKTNICHVRCARWVQLSDHEWRFEITADRFLRNMVRAIVGTLMEVGRGLLTVDGFRKVIEQKDRSAAGDSVPARGLFLQEVEYGPFPEPSPVLEGSSVSLSRAREGGENTYEETQSVDNNQMPANLSPRPNRGGAGGGASLCG